MKRYRINAGNARKWPKVVLFLAVAASLLVIGGVVGVRTIYINNLQSRSASATEDIIFVIDSGDTVEQVADSLEKKEIIRSSWAFGQYVRTRELTEAFKAGTYRLKASQDVAEIVSILTEGRVAMDLFTILPGKRLDQIRQAFLDDGFNQAEVDTALNPNQYIDHPALVDKPDGANLEGYLYPDSYQKIAETTPQTIVRQSLDEMAEALTPSVRAGLAAQGVSVYQGVILASIIEQEIPAAPIAPKEDRRKAAQVFLKRISIDMQLGSDVTAFYGAIIDNAEPSVSYDSPYNTRLYGGFPPTPIGNVTSDGLDAVANPANTDYLYFVAGDGEFKNQTFFTNTVAEHEAAVSRYCRELCN